MTERWQQQKQAAQTVESAQTGRGMLTSHPMAVTSRVLNDPTQAIQTPAMSVEDVAAIKAQVTGQWTSLYAFNLYSAILQYLLNRYSRELQTALYPQF